MAPSWNAVIDAYGMRNAIDDALAVYKEMQAARVVANPSTYDALARPAMRRGEFSFVEKLYNVRLDDFGGNLGAESLGILLNSYANCLPPSPERAIAAFRKEMAAAQKHGIAAALAAPESVLQALRRTVGLNQSCELCWEYGLDPANVL